MAEWSSGRVGRGMAKAKNKLVNIGFENVVLAEHLIAITAANAKPIKRLISEARNANKLIDATNGRKTRSILITDSDHVILSASEPKTLAQRVERAGRYL